MWMEKTYRRQPGCTIVFLRDHAEGAISMRIEGIHYRTGKPICVSVENDKIAEVAASIGSDSAGGSIPILCPGFIDIQVNGCAGIDYSSPNLTAEGIETIILKLAASGTTHHLPTLITGPRERIKENCAVIAKAVRENRKARHAIFGIHLEGPYISPEEGPRGAHDPRWIRVPDLDEFHEWQEAAEGLIRVVTLAPETEGAIHFIEQITKEGLVPAIGHTAASPEQIQQAVSAGARLSTHLGNGSHRLLPRLRNYLWEQLADDRLMASIIADGFHLPDSVLRVFYRSKGVERLILTSDVAFLAGNPPGVYRWGNMSVRVHPDGHLGLEGTEFLAGAGHLLDRGVARMAAACGITLQDAMRMAVDNPAQLLSLPESFTDFIQGEPATLVQLRETGAGNRDSGSGTSSRAFFGAAGAHAQVRIEKVLIAGASVCLTDGCMPA